MNRTLIITFMAFQHSSTCVKFHRPQTVRYERRKSCLSTFNCVSSSKIDVDSMFACQSTLPFRFRVLHQLSSILQFTIVCFTLSFWTVFSSSIVCHTSIFHESDDVCIFVTRCPTDQESGLCVIVDLALNKHALQETNNIVRCIVSSVCFVWSNIYFSFVSKLHLTFHKKIMYPLSVSSCPLSIRMIEDDLNSPTSCAFNQDLQAFIQCSNSLFRTSICFSAQVVSLVSAITIYRLYCAQLRASTLL